MTLYIRITNPTIILNENKFLTEFENCQKYFVENAEFKWFEVGS